MKIRITCRCNAEFDILFGNRNKNEIACPSCGHPLPNGASEDLRAMMKSFSLVESKLDEDSSLYEIKIVD